MGMNYTILIMLDFFHLLKHGSLDSHFLENDGFIVFHIDLCRPGSTSVIVNQLAIG